MAGKIWISRWVLYDVVKSFHKGNTSILLGSWNMKVRANIIPLLDPIDDPM